MTQPDSPPRDDQDDLARVTQNFAARLRQRGVALNDDESPDEIVRLLEAVEAFERAVESRGGDLMVDEPPARGAVQPDDPAFLIPARTDDESVAAYLERLSAATEAVRKRSPAR
jgi:sugar phosphate isomerase/epimerase